MKVFQMYCILTYWKLQYRAVENKPRSLDTTELRFVVCSFTDCDYDQFSCRNGRPRCIPESYVCDNYNDCSDASDESDCHAGHFFTAWNSCASAVLRIVILSVSHIRALWRNEKNISDILIPYKRAITFFLTPTLMGSDVLFHLKFAVKVTHPLRENSDFNQYLLITY